MHAVSVVIPTFNRRKSLERVVRALGEQSVSPDRFEVLVVDDGSRDDTVAWLQQQHFSFTLRLHRQSNGGPAVARNTGIRAAQSDLLLFLDDDVVPDAQLVAEHLKLHQRAPHSLVALGPLASLRSYSEPWVAWEQRQLEKQYAAMERGAWQPTYRQFWTGNASVKRSDVLRAGLFDPRCRRGEDVDLGWRLAELGLSFCFNPKARGLHHASRSLASFCDAHRSYGRLEVEIFGRTSQNEALHLLAGNLARLHPLQRRLLVAALPRPRARRQLERSLRRFLSLPEASRMPHLASASCSLLANLLYWSACQEALGAVRFAELLDLAKARGQAR